MFFQSDSQKSWDELKLGLKKSRFPLIFTDFHGFSLIFYWFSLISIDFHWFSRNALKFAIFFKPHLTFQFIPTFLWITWKKHVVHPMSMQNFHADRLRILRTHENQRKRHKSTVLWTAYRKKLFFDEKDKNHRWSIQICTTSKKCVFEFSKST